MKFTRRDSENGPLLIISDIQPGQWRISDIANQLTIGGTAYADAITEYNGLDKGESYADVIAMPYSWLNDAGQSYFNSANEMVATGNGLMLNITGSSIGQTISNLSTIQKIFIVGGAIVFLAGFFSESSRKKY